MLSPQSDLEGQQRHDLAHNLLGLRKGAEGPMVKRLIEDTEDWSGRRGQA